MSKSILITGGNRGLGLAMVKKFCDLGFSVYATYRNENQLLEVKNEIAGKQVTWLKLDVTKTADIRNIHNFFRENKIKLDVLVNNAGVFLETRDNPSQSSSLLKVDPVIILKTIETNTVGPIKLIQAMIPLMIENGGGRVINISSGLGSLDEMGGNWPGYRMSKTSLNAVTRILHAECHDKGIYVNSICPGWCRTDMGGQEASQSAEEGVETVVWLATEAKIDSGKFYRDKQEIAW